MMGKYAYEDYLIKRDKLPDAVEKKRRKCFVCGKIHMIMVGSITLNRMISINHDKTKTQYLVVAHAPIGCWLVHNKKLVSDFFKSKDNFGWKKKKGKK